MPLATGTRAFRRPDTSVRCGRDQATETAGTALHGRFAWHHHPRCGRTRLGMARSVERRAGLVTVSTRMATMSGDHGCPTPNGSRGEDVDWAAPTVRAGRLHADRRVRDDVPVRGRWPRHVDGMERCHGD